jgi:hypothetical protein
MRRVAVVLLLLVAVTIAQSSDDDQSKPLLGRPDGHEPQPEHPIIGRPDGHEPGSATQRPLIGRPDGHDSGFPSAKTQSPPLGRPDGHEPAASDDDSNYDGGDETDEDDDAENDSHDGMDKAPESAADEDDDPAAGDNDEDGDDMSPFKIDTGDESYNNYETYDQEIPVENSEDDYAERPLIRCKRPLCEMECPNGFENDATGCPTCRCMEAAGATTKLPLIGRPDGHEGGPCDRRPMCRMYCENGFATGDDGCAVCSCLENPCASIDCPEGTVCTAEPCTSHPCTQLTTKCAQPETRTVRCNGPEPMCANFCPGGYKNNAQGCMTCDCVEVPKERQCNEKVCEAGQICRNKTGESQIVKSCTVKTMCESERDRPAGLGAARPTCEADGSFKPLQCSFPAAECWCVDGQGRETDGTRQPVYIEEHKPKCVRNITVSMHIHMTLIVRHDIDITDQMNSLNATIVDHVSTWLLIEPHYIKVVKAKATNSIEDETETENSDGSSNTDDKDDDDDVDEDDDEDDVSGPDKPRMIVIELVVLHDGVSDLPSAADYMRRRMHQGMCSIPMGQNVLDPDANSLQTEHKFAFEPSPAPILYEDIEEPRRHHVMMRYGVCAAAGLFVLLIISAIVMTAVHRHRRIYFRHHVLVAQTSVSSERNLLESEYKPEPVLIVGDDDVAKEKQPIA